MTEWFEMLTEEELRTPLEDLVALVRKVYRDVEYRLAVAYLRWRYPEAMLMKEWVRHW